MFFVAMSICGHQIYAQLTIPEFLSLGYGKVRGDRNRGAREDNNKKQGEEEEEVQHNHSDIQ